MTEFPNSGRIAAIDYGTVRIGIAICDPDRILASPHAVFESAMDDAAADRYIELAKEERIAGFVVGLPVHFDGNESPSSVLARKFATWLCDVTELPTRLFDERFTTVDANARLRGNGLTRQKKKQRIDAVAATVLLEAFMEASRYGGTAAGDDVAPLDG